jgi:hypothetical protein
MNASPPPVHVPWHTPDDDDPQYMDAYCAAGGRMDACDSFGDTIGHRLATKGKPRLFDAWVHLGGQVDILNDASMTIGMRAGGCHHIMASWIRHASMRHFSKELIHHHCEGGLGLIHYAYTQQTIETIASHDESLLHVITRREAHNPIDICIQWDRENTDVVMATWIGVGGDVFHGSERHRNRRMHLICDMDVDTVTMSDHRHRWSGHNDGLVVTKACLKAMGLPVMLPPMHVVDAACRSPVGSALSHKLMSHIDDPLHLAAFIMLMPEEVDNACARPPDVGA